MLHIVCGEQFILVSAEKARSLELKLNVTTKGREWKSIGDGLFAFHTAENSRGGEPWEELYVTQEQHAFLQRLAELTLDECRRL